MGFVSGFIGVYLTMPPSDYSFLKLPRSLEDLHILRDHLESYTSDYTIQVLCSPYFHANFHDTGDYFHVIASRSVARSLQGVVLVVFTATAGASSCYFLLTVIGRPLVFSLWPDKVAQKRERLLNYMLF
ncbi:SNARE associated Golgi protein family [Gossypium australe]|uniref:SNARE associated Golgi protein family n=1 Tax=Gossypium australe TaxID=47621 RepID=A0A5B6W3L1_9ROSI|nr:SNARE associated Golgi protein family [Gossypium australe]